MQKPSSPRRGPSRRLIRLALTLVVTGLCTAYILWKIDIGRSAHIIANARLGYFLLSVGIMIVTIWPMAWRWQLLLRAKGIYDNLKLRRGVFL